MLAELGSSTQSQNLPKRRRFLRVGWVALLAGSLAAAGLVLAHMVLFRLVCHNAPNGSGPNWQNVCSGGDIGLALETLAQLSITLLMVAAALSGFICGLVGLFTLSRGLTMIPPLWLMISTLVYSGVATYELARAMALFQVPPSEASAFAALDAAAALVGWLVISGAVFALTRQLRRASVDR